MRAVAAVTAIRRAPGTLASLGASMRVRLTLWYLVILTLVMLVFSGILIGEARQNEEAAQRAMLAKIAQQLADAYSPADGLIHIEAQTTAKFSATKAQNVLAPGPSLPTQGVALLLDPQGSVTQAMGPLTPLAITQLQQFLIENVASAPGATALSHASGYYGAIALAVSAATARGDAKQIAYVAYSTDVISQGRLVGALVVALPNALDQTTQTALPALLLAVPVTLLVAALGGYWLASRALRPVRLITRAAQEISETDLSRRLRLGSRDELGELAATFDHMLGRLEAAFQRQRQFTADASHELRTPLTIISLEVERALASHRTPQEYERALSVIQVENQVMSRMVSDLLTLARADAGHAQLRLSSLDLSDVAVEAVERLSPLAQRRGVMLAVGAMPEVTLLGDRDALAQALVNLVENGVKHTAGVGSRVTVTTRRESSEDGRVWAVACVTDNGPGIAPEHLPYLFERFYQVNASRVSTAHTGDTEDTEVTTDSDDTGSAAREGSGLGLAISQWAAQAHGGELRVRSAVGAGSTFELW
ncbi:MAG TPA: ATP-binding protein, partial [Ktedonobacterales bacterium]|nr:ATP-binding protein [Ktedonobacterales bacterium]